MNEIKTVLDAILGNPNYTYMATLILCGYLLRPVNFPKVWHRSLIVAAAGVVLGLLWWLLHPGHQATELIFSLFAAAGLYDIVIHNLEKWLTSKKA